MIVGPCHGLLLTAEGIGQLVVMNGGSVVVLRALDLIPLIIGHAVLVSVYRHPDDSWLGIVLKSIAKHGKVALARHIDHGMVEVERHVAAPGTQRNHTVGLLGVVACNSLRTFLCYGLRRVVGCRHWQRVHKLPRSRDVFVNSIEIGGLGKANTR